jgi:Rv0078B-related antitoxin
VGREDRLVERLHTAFDLWATGVALQRQTIRRSHPEASDAEVEVLLTRWLQHRPGAEMGDGPQPIDS